MTPAQRRESMLLGRTARRILEGKSAVILNRPLQRSRSSRCPGR